MTLEALGGDGNLTFGTNGITYGAGTGKLKITYKLGTLESTFSVTGGSVFIGHNVFTIAEGTDLATDLKNFIPALNFTTGDAGTYTINGQTITTSAEGLALTATDNQMVFTTSSDVVEYDGMTFAGNGKVTLTAQEVTLGKNVIATGFGEGNSFVLAEAGNVTADAKVFELSELEDIPMKITVTGAKDGFIFSRTLTAQSEEYLGYENSPYVGEVFTEKFISAGDDSYRIRTDPIGLEEVIGISDGATITGGASLADEQTLSYYDLVTDTTGKFTIGEKTYNVSGDSSVAIRARFDEGQSFASAVRNLNGTVSGDFSAGAFKINDGSSLRIFGDTDVSVVADEFGFEILGLDAGASLQVSASGIYSVNSVAINANAEDVIVGVTDGAVNFSSLNIAGTSTDPVQLVKNIAGRELDSFGEVTIPEGDADFRGSEYPQIVSLGSGTQEIYFNNSTGNIAIVGDEARGWKNIHFGNGDALAVFTAPDSEIRTTVGTGDNSIVTADVKRVRIDMTDGDNTTIIPLSGKVTLENYNGNGTIQTDIADLGAAILSGTITLHGDEIKLNSATKITLKNSNGSANLADANGSVTKVDFTDTSATLTAGNKNSTILAGAKDFVDAGDGNNQIYLTESGATVLLSGSGHDTIHDFNDGFGGDKIQVADLSDVQFKFERDGLLISSGDARAKIDGLTDGAEILLSDGQSTLKTAVVASDEILNVTRDEGLLPNAFFGRRSGLDFGDLNEEVIVNLADGTGSIGGRSATFDGINKLTAGKGRSTLIGSDNRETLTAGAGFASIFSGAGNDKMFGNSSDDKTTSTEFFFLAGDGHDTISDFGFLTAQNNFAGTADKINITDANAVTDAFLLGSDVVIQINDGNDFLTLKDAAGKDFKINNLVAKVDRNISYDGLANCYVADGGTSVNVDASVDDAEIWLDNSHGKYFLGNIRTLDASNANGFTSLVGNDFDNTLIAGKSDSSLWGGLGDDLLIGGGGRNTFFYCLGNGNDTIQNATDGDEIILADVTLEQIGSTKISSDGVTINFTDGGSLTVDGNAEINWRLADGATYNANK